MRLSSGNRVGNKKFMSFMKSGYNAPVKKLINLFVIFSLMSGLVPGGGFVVVHASLEKYVSGLSKESPLLYQKMSHEKDLAASFCGAKSLVQPSRPQGLVSAFGSIQVELIPSILDSHMAQTLPPLSGLFAPMADSFSSSPVILISTPPPKLV
jgi:hypothetical protein